MKRLAILIIVVGVFLAVFNTCNYDSEHPVLEDKNVIINKEQKQYISWPRYAGGIIALVGIVLLFSERKKRIY